jgi:hypothetical protein
VGQGGSLVGGRAKERRENRKEGKEKRRDVHAWGLLALEFLQELLFLIPNLLLFGKLGLQQIFVVVVVSGIVLELSVSEIDSIRNNT